MSSESKPTGDLPAPSTEQLLYGVLTLGREVHLEMDEPALVQRFLKTLTSLFPKRAFAVRVLDLRSSDKPSTYVAGSTLRRGVTSERITLTASSLDKTRLKSAVRNSAWLRLSERWDSPFPRIAVGFAVPLVASGEFYGVLDIGYPLGTDRGEEDKPLILPIANHLSVALRNERLHRDTTVLRDYQAKLIEHANALILGIDRRWRITVCNQALCHLTGYSRDEVIGRDVRDWLSSDELPRLTKLFREALSGSDIAGRADSVDITIKSRRGPVRTVWSIAAISGRGQIDAVVAIGQDQTKLRELQRQVIQAEKLATLGQLAAGVVHELNNPLTSISVYAEYLRGKVQHAFDKGEPLEVKSGDIEKLRRITASAQRISEFAKELVQYAKPAGEEFELVDVNSVAKQSLSFCEHLFEQSGVKLTASLAAQLPSVDAVPGQLEQVLINLITNAAHAVEKGGEVIVETSSPTPETVEIAVRDNGPGVAPEYREKIFEPFFTTKTDGKGTGLGLSIVRNIIDQHSGKISVSDAEGGGAIFTVTLQARQTQRRDALSEL